MIRLLMKTPWKINPIVKLINRYRIKIRAGVVIAVVVFVYMFVATGEALWQNYQINQDIVKLKMDIIQVGEENIQLKNLIAYLKTESFREKEARRKLGYKKPNEVVVAIPQSNFIYTQPGTTQSETTTDNQTHLTNPQKWWEYVFG